MHPQASEPGSRCGSEGAVGGEGLPQSKQGQRFSALTCTFAPLAGFEPAPYGLEVDPLSSTPSRRVLFSLVRSGVLSS